MRILFLLQDLPYPPSTGINSKAYNVIRYLASKGWHCDILCFGSYDAASRIGEFETAVPGVKVLGVYSLPGRLKALVNKIRFFCLGLPPSFGEFRCERFIKALRSISINASYDVVHYDVINMAQYLPDGPNVPSVLSSNDAISLSYSRMVAQNRSLLRKIYLTIAAFLIKRFEKDTYPKFLAVHVVSAEDASYLSGISPEMRVKTIPIAADESFIGFNPAGRGKNAPLRMVFSGNLNIPGIANGLFEFLDKVYGQISTTSPFLEFYVLGPKASPLDEERVSLHPRVKYFRWVEDYKNFIAAADIVLILDKSGTGIKTRVLDAMALGRPVVGSKIALSGLDVENARHCLIANTPAEIVQAVTKLIESPDMREQMGRDALALIRSKYSMAVIGPQWETLYLGLKGSR